MKDFTYQQLGALLIAVGAVMGRRDLCAQATLDGHSEDELMNVMLGRDIDKDVATELLKLDISEVVEYVAGYPKTEG